MMDKLELLTIIKGQLNDTIKYANDEFRAANKSLSDSYEQKPYGNEIEGRSKVVSSDHFDMVESDMPPLARIFLGANKILSFKPFGKDDAEEARQKTDYAHYLIREQRDSFKILHDWIKEPGLAKCSVVKFYCDEEEKPSYHFFEGVNEDEAAALLDDLESQPKVDRVEIESQTEGDSFDVRFRVTRKSKKIKIVNVPLESFIMSRGATSKDTAEIVGDECIKTKGELIAEGFSKDLIKDLLPMPMQKGQESQQERFRDQGGWDYKSGYHWTQERLTVQNLYVLVDYDEDGIPERRYIQKVGDEILENEPYGVVPYAINSQILMPHRTIGKSRGEPAQQYQLEKTAIKRGMMDNIYSVNRPRYAVDDGEGRIDGGKVDLDDMSIHQIGGYVRTDGSPHDAIMPLVTPYIGSEALQIIQYLDTEKSNSLGAQLANQGLTSDKFYKETATRFEGVTENAEAKIELVGRVLAETGFRDLFEGVIWTAQHYQDEATEIMVLGKPLMVDPRQWRHEHYTQSAVGLGAGDSADAIENLGAMLNTQMTLMQATNPGVAAVVDSQKIYNTLDDLARALGKPDTSRYYNDPQDEQAQLLPMVEKLMADNQALMQQVQGNNMLAEAEKVRAEAKLMGEQNKRDIESAKLQQNKELELAQMQQDWKKFQAEIAERLTKLDLEYGRDVPGSMV